MDPRAPRRRPRPAQRRARARVRVTAIVCAAVFLVWFLILHGPARASSPRAKERERGGAGSIAAPASRHARRTRVQATPRTAGKRWVCSTTTASSKGMSEEEVNKGLREQAAERRARRRSRRSRRSTSPRLRGRRCRIPRIVNAITYVSRRGMHRYPHLSGSELRNELAQRHEIDPARLFLGNGSAELLSSAARALLEPGAAAADDMALLSPVPDHGPPRTRPRGARRRRCRGAARRGRRRGHAGGRPGKPQRPDRRAARRTGARAAARRAARRRGGAAGRVARRVLRRPAQ